MMTPESAASCLRPLATWFDARRRDLPWRAQDLDVPHPDPWAVLVSELMLQQTQVATVIPYFQRWMEAFPTPAALASAEDTHVMKCWEGLGYYRRARFLKAAATVIAREGWPKDPEGLRHLPGIGPYTAGALSSIAFQWPEPALDGNAFRVLTRFLGLEGEARLHEKTLAAWLRPALAELGPARLTQAVMELGALVCTPSPACATCPLQADCAAHRMEATGRIPAPRPRAVQKEVELLLVACTDGRHWLLRPPGSKGLLAGLWSWPTLEAPSLPSGVDADGFQLRTFPGWTQVYTHRREHVMPVCLEVQRPDTPPGLQWVDAASLPTLPLGKRDLRLRDHLLLDPPPLIQDLSPWSPAALWEALGGGDGPAPRD